MSRKILMFAMVLLMLSGCSKKTEIHFDSNTVYEDLYEFQEEDEVSSISDYEKELASLAVTKVGKPKDGKAVVEITAPDVYRIIMEFAQNSSEFKTEAELFHAIMEKAQSSGCEKVTQKIEIAVENRDGTWYAAASDEYRDAVTGGLYTAMSEIAQNIIAEAAESLKGGK